MKKHLLAICVAVLASTAVAGVAMEPTTGPMTANEKAFWECMKVPNYGIQPPGEGPDSPACAAAFQKVLDSKFNGDFSKYIVWRRANEASQLARLSAQ